MKVFCVWISFSHHLKNTILEAYPFEVFCLSSIQIFLAFIPGIVEILFFQFPHIEFPLIHFTKNITNNLSWPSAKFLTQNFKFLLKNPLSITSDIDILGLFYLLRKVRLINPKFQEPEVFDSTLLTVKTLNQEWPVIRTSSR